MSLVLCPFICALSSFARGPRSLSLPPPAPRHPCVLASVSVCVVHCVSSPQTFSRVTSNMEMAEKSKLDFLKVIGGFHMRILEGSDSLVQLSGLIAKLCLLKSTVAPSA